jgi:hypothetical protein
VIEAASLPDRLSIESRTNWGIKKIRYAEKPFLAGMMARRVIEPIFECRPLPFTLFESPIAIYG